ncbi:MAG: TGS domain-containing protein [Candidatus Korarchaeota archaeon NZ13-K]|nr:MAG: TGS domain-containing protein [Candidatus Korarchaeota archaeon NZ13-K]
MPTNLPPEAQAKWEEYSKAKTPEEKLQKLREFYSLIPKHKGTEKMEKFIKRRMAELKEEIERKRYAKKSKGVSLMVEKRGAAQMVLVGFTNSGRSTLLARLTNARPEISPKPFTTMRPVEGMMDFRGAQVQVVEAPPLIPEAQGGPTNLAIALAKNSDVLGITVSSVEDPIGSLETIFGFLESREISFERPAGRVRIKRSRAAPALIIINKGRLVDCSEREVRELLLQFGIDRAWVEIEGSVTMDDVEEAIFGEKSYKPAIIFLTKSDMLEDPSVVDEVRRRYESKVIGVVASPTQLPSRDELGEMILRELGLIRVFTKSKNERLPSERAVILPRNSSVIDLAEFIHESFKERFRYAKVWSGRLPYSPMKVGPDFLLEDGDVVEIVVS